MSRLTLKVFRSQIVRTVSLAVACLLLVSAGYGVWWAFSSPTEVEEQVMLLRYQHDGEFDHQVYAKPNILRSPAEDGGPNPVYFTKLVESVDVVFSYRFLFEEPVTEVTELVKISAILENTGMWQHEVILVPETRKTGDFTISFPFDAAQFQALTDKIGQEIGIRNVVPDITLKASVRTEAQTEFGVLKSDFVQTAKVKLTRTIMEWDENLAVYDRGSHYGSRYEHQGVFDYNVKLGPNILYGGPIILVAQTPPPESPVALAPSTSYSTATIDDLDLLFSYQFKSDKPVERVLEEVKVTAVLTDQDRWSETYVLVPKRRQSGDFTISFPVDLRYFYEVIEAKQRELRVFAQSHRLVIDAEVHTIARNEAGLIDEVFTESLNLTLAPTSVGWATDITKTESGSITKSVIVPRPEVEGVRKWVPAVMSVMLLAFLYVAWNYTQVKPRRLSAIEAELKKARKKYKNVIVDAQELPRAGFTETVIELGSLEGLIKTADDLLKPALHKADTHRHTYCVIDGSTRYEYVIQTRLPQMRTTLLPKV